MADRLLVTALFSLGLASACSNLLISREATTEGATIMTYNADDDSLFGSIDLRPANANPPATRPIWDWDSQIYLGTIPEVARTLNVVGNVNEKGLIMTETTFGGEIREIPLCQSRHCIQQPVARDSCSVRNLQSLYYH